VVTITTGLPHRMLGASTLDRKAALRPKAILVDNLLYALELSRIIRMVNWKIKELLLIY